MQMAPVLVPWDEHPLHPLLDPIVARLGLDARARARAAAVCHAWAEAVRRAFPPGSRGLRLGSVPNHYHPMRFALDGVVSPSRLHTAVTRRNDTVLVDLATGAVLARFPAEGGEHHGRPRFNRDGTLLLVGSCVDEQTCKVSVYRVPAGELVYEIEDDSGHLSGDFGSVASDLLAVTFDDNFIALHSATTGERVSPLLVGDEFNRGEFRSIRVSPDDSLIADIQTCFEGDEVDDEEDDGQHLMVYAVASGARVARLFMGMKANDVMWSPDGTRVAVVTDAELRVWEVATWTLFMKLPCPASSCDWSADGRLLLTSVYWEPIPNLNDKQSHLRVLDAETGLQRAFLTREFPAITDRLVAAFATDEGGAVAVFGEDYAIARVAMVE